MGISKKTIAILGASSHIAKNLITQFANEGYNLFLFARSLNKVENFLEVNHIGNANLNSFNEFGSSEYDVIINCVGIGDPAKLLEEGVNIFTITEKYDNLVLEYLSTYPNSLYINLSSGTVYGKQFELPVDNYTITHLNVNDILYNDYYCIAKINSEAKHRGYRNLNIVDLRIFGYYSRFIDVKAQYLLSEIILCIRMNKELQTGPQDISRDYIHPTDLFSLIKLCMVKQCLNDSFDVYSLGPVKKFELLDYFKEKYGLNYRITNEFSRTNVTGNKNNYYSINRKASEIGYSPKYTSFETIVQETKNLFNYFCGEF